MDQILSLMADFQLAADPDRAREMEAYMRNQFPFWGIPSPDRKAIFKAYLDRWKKEPAIDWDLVEALWSLPQREYAYCLADYLAAKKKSLGLDDLDHFLPLIMEKSWWDMTDSLNKTIGQIGLKDPALDEAMLAWAHHENFWVRRVAILHQLGRKGATKPDLLEAILTANFGSQEFFINKAIGWALRDYSKTNPAWVKSFIDKHESSMAPLSIKEGSKYL